MEASTQQVGPGKYRELQGWLGWLIKAYAVAIVLYHVAYVLHIPDRFGLYIALQPFVFLSLGLILSYAFLRVPATKRTPRDKLAWYDVILSIVTAALPFYLNITYSEKILTLGLIQNQQELVMGTLMLIGILEAMRRTTGWILPSVIILFIIYAFTCQHFPGFFQGRGYAFDRVVGVLSQTEDSVFGVAYRIAATVVLCFMLFARFLERSGAGTFFINLANSLLGSVRGGPAKAAVVASGMFGTISGSCPANVVSTGTFTIPTMKKMGFSAEYAGAVEAVSSSGGHLMPPVMGAVAFLIADFLEISYWSVCVAAFIPALFFYFAEFMQIDFMAAKDNLRGLPRHELPPLGRTLMEGWPYLVPLVVLVLLLSAFNQTPQTASLGGVVSLFLIGLFKKGMRMGPRRILSATEGGLHQYLDIGFICAGVGMIIGIVVLTGIGLRLSSGLIHLAGGSLLLLLVLAAVSSLILGMGMPSVSAYIVLVILVAPALKQLGIPLLAAHLFIFYFAIASFITPPVCISAYVAAGISGGSMIKTGLHASRIGIVVYIVPFLFVYNPVLLLEGDVAEIVLAVISGGIGIVLLAAGFQGHLLKKATWLQRLLFLLGGFLLFVPGLRSDVIGFSLGILMALWQYGYKNLVSLTVNKGRA
ncbi:TRAP transporter fused permease subunit [bacterium]|nr:TRAP transporter fused permease subunit [bacterium]